MPTINRYQEGQSGRGGLMTALTVRKIRFALRAGQLSTVEYITKEGDRLDRIAFTRYGDPRLWWIIAAASNIGWWLQIPPGTVLIIPTNLSEIGEII